MDATQYPGKPGDTIYFWAVGVNIVSVIDASRLGSKAVLSSGLVLGVSPSYHSVYALFANGWVLNQVHIDDMTSVGYTVHKNISSYKGSGAWKLKSTHWVLSPPATKASVVIAKPRNPGDPYIDGACCSKCGTFAIYQNPGFVCYACNEDPYRTSSLMIDDDDFTS